MDKKLSDPKFNPSLKVQTIYYFLTIITIYDRPQRRIIYKRMTAHPYENYGEGFSFVPWLVLQLSIISLEYIPSFTIPNFRQQQQMPTTQNKNLRNLLYIDVYKNIKLMPNYGDISYWNSRYQKQEGDTFDWLEDFNSLKHFIIKYLKDIPNPKILNLGCGNSIICENLYDEGYQNIFNIDISEVVIEQMIERNQHRPNMKFQTMNALELEYENDSFDLVIDKSTLDAILCGSQSFINAAQMIKEVQRILKPGGVYQVISYGDPNSRMQHFTRNFLYFEIEVENIQKEVEIYEEEEIKKQILNHYIYNCQKSKNYNLKEAESSYLIDIEQLKEEERQNEFQEQFEDILHQYHVEKGYELSQLIEKLNNEESFIEIMKELGYI